MFLIIKMVKELLQVVCFLLCTGMTYAQVGISVKQPKADLDVDGEVRLRAINTTLPSTKVVVANENGDLGYIPKGADNYEAKDIFYKMIDPEVVNAGGSNAGYSRLGLDITVEVEPFTEVAIAIEYNIPVTMWRSAPNYAGITLMKTNNANNRREELDEGSRKYTSFDTRTTFDGYYIASMPVTGKATDIVVNKTANTMSFTYSTLPYIEGGAGIVHFGDFTDGRENFGTGILLVQVYEKKIK